MSGNLERVLRVMAERKASDVYISANSPILIRIEGQVSQLSDQELSASQTRKLLAEMLTPQQLEEFDETGELNIGLTLPDVGAFRLSAFRQRGSIAAVFRFIPYDIPALDTLGLPESLADMVLEKHGLILVVGASGSGKSTTLAAMLDWRNQNLAGHILTIEDPIEYLFTHKRAVVNQREVGRDTAAAQTALRNALRQSPDCLLIGEIRDRETMSLALAYALSGHLVLATMHANNTYHALNRVLSFYPPEARPSLLMDLASGLKSVISQRLLQSLEGGRVPAVEIMRNSRGVAELIDKGDLLGIKDAMEKAVAPGSQTFEQDLARLVAEGTVAREEALAFADSPTNLIWRLDNAAPAAPRAAKPAKEVDEGATYHEYTIEVKPPARGRTPTGSTGWQVLR